MFISDKLEAAQDKELSLRRKLRHILNEAIEDILEYLLPAPASSVRRREAGASQQLATLNSLLLGRARPKATVVAWLQSRRRYEIVLSQRAAEHILGKGGRAAVDLLQHSS